MTVCIVVVCKENTKEPNSDKQTERKRIIVGTDWRVSSPLGSAEIRLKQHRIGSGWYCACAGNDSDILALVAAFRRSFGTATVNETNVKPLIESALNARKKEKANEYIQGRYALSYDDFLNIGKDKLPPDLHREALLKVSEIVLGAQCIVFGFLEEDDPILIETTDRCVAHIREDFAVAGEGAYLAQTALLQRLYMSPTMLGEAVYCVYEAKRYAEQVNSVGEYTTIAIYGYKKNIRDVSDGGFALLKKQFTKFGPHKITEDVHEVANFVED